MNRPSQNDIPLQTPPGNYHKPWYKKHGWTLGPIGFVIIAVVIAGLVAPDPKGPPTVILNLKTQGEVALGLSEGELKVKPLVKDQQRQLHLELTNEDDFPALVRVTSLPPSVTGVTICWQLGQGPKACGGGPLGRIEPRSKLPVVVTVASDHSDSSTFDLIVIFVSSLR
jgi:hypothetical protein